MLYVIVQNAVREHSIVDVDFLKKVQNNLTLFILLHYCVVVLVELDLLHDYVLHS
jgi:hypothetical protein